MSTGKEIFERKAKRLKVQAGFLVKKSVCVPVNSRAAGGSRGSSPARVAPAPSSTAAPMSQVSCVPDGKPA